MSEPTDSPAGAGTLGRALLCLENVRHISDAGLPTEREVLAGIDLSIAAGERVGLFGVSGAGKTTLAILLAGLADPASGRLFDDGIERRRGTSPPPGNVGLVFQESEAAFFEESVLADVAFGPKALGLRESEALHRAEEALRLVGLDPDRIGPRAPETLSGGEARRAAIAGVLAFRPRLVVFDEPTTGLDADGVERLRSILESTHARGAATLVISHELPFLLDHCDRMILLEKGKIAWDGPAAKLPEEAPEDWRREALLGGGEMLSIAAALRAQGWIGAEVPPTPEALATAWAAAVSARRN